MPSRKQRRRREKLKRHEWEYVQLDEEGNEVPLEPAEAKKVVANVFAAPGRVEIRNDEIRVRLAPASNRTERAAIAHLLAQLTAMRLTLPRDSRRRALRFDVQPS